MPPQATEFVIGIDLGTTNSLIATVEAGIPYVIADAEGERLTPSVVHFPGAGAAPLVGRAAARLRAARVFIDDDDLVFLNDVIDVFFHEKMGAQHLPQIVRALFSLGVFLA